MTKKNSILKKILFFFKNSSWGWLVPCGSRQVLLVLNYFSYNLYIPRIVLHSCTILSSLCRLRWILHFAIYSFLQSYRNKVKLFYSFFYFCQNFFIKKCICNKKYKKYMFYFHKKKQNKLLFFVLNFIYFFYKKSKIFIYKK